jgi:transketolase
MRNTVMNRITGLARTEKNIFMVTGDAGFGVLDEFQRRFPDRFLNLGVAEQNMIGCAAGLAMTGFRVVVYNIIPFLLYRCYEQVRNDICYQNLPVTLVGIGSGVTYAPQGITHYSVEDIMVARTLPNLAVLSPCDPLEATKCVDFAMKSKKPVYIRVAKSGEVSIHKKCPGAIEKPIVVREGTRVAVLFYGSVATEAVKATFDLNPSPRVLSLPMIQPLNFAALRKTLKGMHTIITVEEHFIEGGLGSIIADWIAREGLPFKLIKLGIKNEFIHAIKNVTGMRCYYGICAERIRHEVKKAWRKET